MINWSNHDRAAFNDFLNSDLGVKAIRYLEQSRPKFPDKTTLDLNALAISGAVQMGYDTAIAEIERMRAIATPAPPAAKYIKTHED